MRHQHAFRKFSRTTAHRRAMFRNMATALVLHNRIETTLPKAKDLKRIADKLITLGKSDTLANRRRAMAYLMPINKEAKGNAQKWTAVHKLFTELAPQFQERNGGYTRVLRTRIRPGDATQMALIAFVEGGAVESKGTEKKRTRRVAKAAPAPVAAPMAASEVQEAEVVTSAEGQ